MNTPSIMSGMKHPEIGRPGDLSVFTFTPKHLPRTLPRKEEHESMFTGQLCCFVFGTAAVRFCCPVATHQPSGSPVGIPVLVLSHRLNRSTWDSSWRKFAQWATRLVKASGMCMAPVSPHDPGMWGATSCHRKQGRYSRVMPANVEYIVILSPSCM